MSVTLTDLLQASVMHEPMKAMMMIMIHDLSFRRVTTISSHHMIQTDTNFKNMLTKKTGNSYR